MMIFMPAPAAPNAALAALADPGCRALLVALGQGERSVTHLVRELDAPQPQVSKRLAVLRSAGLVRVRPAGRWRYYRADAPALRGVANWLERFTVSVNERMDRLEDVVAEIEEGKHDGEDKLKR